MEAIVMGLFGIFSENEVSPETVAHIRNSECGQLFANNFCKFLSVGDPYYQWLMGNSKYRGIKIEVFKNGVRLVRFDISQGRPTEYGYDYDVSREGWNFGSVGYEDLPNKEYVQAFSQFLSEQITSKCPNVTVTRNKTTLHIKLADSAKKGW